MAATQTGKTAISASRILARTRTLSLFLSFPLAVWGQDPEAWGQVRFVFLASGGSELKHLGAGLIGRLDATLEFGLYNYIS